MGVSGASHDVKGRPHRQGYIRLASTSGTMHPNGGGLHGLLWALDSCGLRSLAEYEHHANGRDLKLNTLSLPLAASWHGWDEHIWCMFSNDFRS
jgi:hypothetical protein